MRKFEFYSLSELEICQFAETYLVSENIHICTRTSLIFLMSAFVCKISSFLAKNVALFMDTSFKSFYHRLNSFLERRLIWSKNQVAKVSKLRFLIGRPIACWKLLQGEFHVLRFCKFSSSVKNFVSTCNVALNWWSLLF